MTGNVFPVERTGLRRLVRYGSVSAISTLTSLSVLGVLVGAIGFPATWANVIAVAVGTVPSFTLNRRWVWSCIGRTSLLGQVVPYCVLSFSGLILSTLAVHVASGVTAGSSRLVQTSAVEVANFGSYAVLWLLQFVLCDRILFHRSEPAASQTEPHEAGRAA